MQKSIFNTLFICFSYLLTLSVSAQNDLGLNVNLVTWGNQQKIEASFEIDRLSTFDSPDGVLAYYMLTNSENDTIQSDSLKMTTENTYRVNNTFFFNFILKPFISSEATLSVTLEDTILQRKEIEKLVIPKINNQVSFSIKNLSNPNYTNYIKVGDSLIFETKDEKSIYLIQFKHEFLAAAPPMQTEFNAGQRNMQVAKTVNIPSNKPFVLNESALYFAQEDSSSNVGVGLKVVEPDFPKFKKIDKVASSLIYISTNTEITNMRNTSDKKATLDNFWLNLGGTMDNSRRLIRLYYQRVAYANQNFTNYKLGWKTDKGIVHVIFGKPDEIIKEGERERWTYNSSGQGSFVVFDFIKKPNLFSDNHYELVRSPKYKKLWSDTVNQWRKGLVRK